MSPRLAVEAAAAGRPGDEAELDQIGLDHFLDRVARLRQAGRERLHADRAALVDVRDHVEVAAIHRVEAERVDLQPLQRGIGDARVDYGLARDMGEVAHPPQQAAGAAEVDAKVADAALTRMEVDALGLDAMDRRYLHMIADIYKGGPVGVETLAAGLSEPRDTIEEVIEPYLIQLGLVARTARGRCLNGRGWTHLGLPVPEGGQPTLFGS